MADISIVIPAYNEEDNIADLVKKIESCVAISHELVLVNDHSTDRTPELLAQLSQNFANVKFVENTGAPGFGNALKAGFNQAAAELVVPVMADMCDD
ncbi:MAG: glycosyltransferase family 2 protein, partial [Deltaproteobacteria bacterium]